MHKAIECGKTACVDIVLDSFSIEFIVVEWVVDAIHNSWHTYIGLGVDRAPRSDVVPCTMQVGNCALLSSGTATGFCCPFLSFSFSPLLECVIGVLA